MAAIVAVTAMVAPSVAAAGPYCGIHWGSTGKAGTGQPSSGVGPLVNVRGGQHECYDRLVIDFNGQASAYEVEYVPGVPHQALDGDLPLRGGAFLNIVLRTTTYDVGTGTTFFTPIDPTELIKVQGWQTLRQVAFGGSFEGSTTIGAGVRARVPFRVFTLLGPNSHSRLVIDIAHQW